LARGKLATVLIRFLLRVLATWLCLVYLASGNAFVVLVSSHYQCGFEFADE
jgi:hypothetical protein